MLPSGIVRKDKISIIGNGVVLDLSALKKEITSLVDRGVKISPHNLFISDRATIILPIHQKLDAIRENNNLIKIGTTKRGIGPAYEDKVGRRSIRVMDLRSEKNLDKRQLKIAEHILKENLTVIPQFHSHLEAMRNIGDIDLQITLSFSEANTISLDGPFSKQVDPTRYFFLSFCSG